MSSTLPERRRAHLSLWRRFHDAIARDAERLTRLLTGPSQVDPRHLTAWWDRFVPAVTQCSLMAAGQYGAEGPVVSDARTAAPTLLLETVEMMGLAAGLLPATAELHVSSGSSAPSDRAPLARRAVQLARRHEADSVAYLARAVSTDAYRTWEQGAISRLTYRNLTFLAPWLLDTMSSADRQALLRDVPHLRAMRCDELWVRRYQHITAALRQSGAAPSMP